VESPVGFRFCGACGAPLVAGEGRRERRVVSILLADLVGFTGRSERLDVEDVEAFLEPYRELLRRAVESFGGVVSDFAGDGVMAVFGAPVAHEDDPERAVRAGLAICSGVDELAGSDERFAGLRVRVGITSGEALVTRRAGAVAATGDVVNTAARLEAAAGPGRVLVDEYTHRATSRVVLFEEATAVEAKGKTQPVVAWRAVEPRSTVPEQAREQLPLVGRERESDLLRGLLDRARMEPSTQLITLVGPPGIGKTRLVSELASHVEQITDLVTWRQGRSLAYGEGVAFWALGEMVKSQAGILESDTAETAAEKLAEAVAGVLADERDRDWVETHLRPLVGLDGRANASVEDSQLEAFAAWRRFFEALAEDGPTVLVFEDIHWADDALLDFVDLLADRAGAVPLLIVCTARPELFEQRPAWGGGKTNTTTIGLVPLSPAETARVVSELLDQVELPVDLERQLLARAEGNPFYAQEYVRMLRDRGLLTRNADGWSLVASPVGLPESVEGVIAARLDTLGNDERLFMGDAAVFGRVCWLGAVCAMGDRSERDSEQTLHRLERTQLLQRNRRSSVEGEIEFTFAHALTQEVAYARIPRAERAAGHERAASWLQQLSGERGDSAELLAYHLTSALSLDRQAGGDTGRLAPLACAALVEAGRQAQAVNAQHAAARHYQHALELMPERDPERPRVLLDHASVLYYAGTVDEPTLQRALAAQVAVEDWAAAARAEYLLGRPNLWGHGDRAQAHLERAADYASRVAYSVVASLIASSQVLNLAGAGRVPEAVAQADSALARADAAGSEVGWALVLGARGWARAASGDVGGIDDLHEGVSVLSRHSHPNAAPANANMASCLLLAYGDLPRASQALVAADALAQRFGWADQIDFAAVGRALLDYHEGRWDSAVTSANGVVSRAIPYFAFWARVVLARVALARGDTRDARGHADAMLAFARDTSDREVLLEALLSSALVEAALGEGGAARRAIGDFCARAQPLGALVSMVAVSMAELAVACEGAGERQAIMQIANPLPDASRWKLAILAATDQRYAEAVTRFEEIGSRTLEAAAHLQAARQAEREHRFQDATRHAGRAVEFYRSVGATRFQHAAEVVAGRIAVQGRDAP
jgi:class 3 adenylate cyclase/tetratricopeptide (TPR) repeat protein